MMKKFRITVDGKTYEVEVEELTEEGEELSQPAPVKRPAPKKQAPAPKKPQTPAQPAQPTGGGSAGGSITAPIAGTMLKINVSQGDKVEKGQVVAILEAMKMENEITADSAGTVKEIKVSEGANVNSGDELIILE